MTLARHRRLRELGLAAGTLGSTAGQTLMVALLPVLLHPYAPSAVWIGLAIGAEGALALLVPYWIGHLSDHLPATLVRRFGRRTFFLLVAAPIMAIVLAIAPFLRGYWPLVGVGFAYFAAMHAYLTPLWALGIDAVPSERRGRLEGVRGALHSAGLAYGLVMGGLLYGIWPPLPFLVGATLVLATTALTLAAVPPELRDRELETAEPHVREEWRVWKELRHQGHIRRFLVANALWTGSVDGIRPYVFLYAVLVLGISIAEASLVLFILVVGLGLGAYTLGYLADRYDRARLLQLGTIITGIAMTLGVLVRSLPGAIALLVAAGIGAAAFITLPYPLFVRLVGERALGRYTGLYVLSTGLGRIVAPTIVGAAIDIGRPLLPGLRGYPLMWPVAGAMALLSTVLLRKAVQQRPGPE
ncbi:MAG TPA: MFS transporter [Longimicrobiales bacterium]